MKAITITLAGSLILMSVSCRGTGGTIPDMPYTGAAATPAPAVATPTPLGEPQTISDAQLIPPMDGITPTVSPAPSSATIPAPTPVSPTTPTYGSALLTPASTPTPAASPSYAPVPSTPTPAYTPPVATPTPAAVSPAASSSVPVAQRVTGDPHRVINPWNPNQRIKITDPKTGLPFPSGKVLGIPNSDKKFMVP